MAEEDVIMGFVKWAFKNGKRLDIYSYDEIQHFIDIYMSERIVDG